MRKMKAITTTLAYGQTTHPKTQYELKSERLSQSGKGDALI